MKIALSFTLGCYSPDPAVIENTRAVADALRAAGAIVEEVDLPWTLEEVLRTSWAHFGAVMGPFIESVGNGDPEQLAQLMPYTHAFIDSASDSMGYVDGLAAETAFYRPLGEILGRYDALLCPTIANTGMPADAACTDSKATFSELMTLPFNIVGRVPVLAIPSGRAPNGVPTGVQIVGRTFDDQTVFRIGAAAEAELGLWTNADWWPAF